MKARSKGRSVTRAQIRLHDAIAAREVAWMLEYLPEHPKPQDDPLRTWLVFRLAGSETWQREFWDAVLNRWLECLANELVTAKDLRRLLRRWVWAFQKVLNHGRSQNVVPGMSPMLEQKVYERSIDWSNWLLGELDCEIKHLKDDQ